MSCGDVRQRQNCKDPEGSNKKRTGWGPTEWSAIGNLVLTFFLVLFTGALIWVGYQQAQSTKQSAAVAQNQLKQAALMDRPWVAIEVGGRDGYLGFDLLHKIIADPESIKTLDPKKEIQLGVRVVFRNGGRTVARIRKITYELEMRLPWDVPLPKDWWFNKDTPELLIAPGGTLEQFASYRFSRDEIYELALGDARDGGGLVLFVLAAAIYEDPLGTRPFPESALCKRANTFFDPHEEEWRTLWDFSGGSAYNFYT